MVPLQEPWHGSYEYALPMAQVQPTPWPCMPAASIGVATQAQKKVEGARPAGMSCQFFDFTCRKDLGGHCRSPVEMCAEMLAETVAFWSAWDLGVWTRPEKAALVDWLKGHVWALSCHKHGTHFLQKVIASVDPEQQATLASEFNGKVHEAWYGPSAKYSNYALQKFISDVPADSIPFMLEEMARSCKRHEKTLQYGDRLNPDHPACHRYGCRVLQRMIEHFGSPVFEHKHRRVFKGLQEIGRWLELYIVKLALHEFGVHVLQKAHEHNMLRLAAVHTALQGATGENLREIAKTSRGSNFLQQAITQRGSIQDIGAEASRMALVKRVMSDELMCNKKRFGCSFLTKVAKKEYIKWQESNPDASECTTEGIGSANGSSPARKSAACSPILKTTGHGQNASYGAAAQAPERNPETKKRRHRGTRGRAGRGTQAHVLKHLDLDKDAHIRNLDDRGSWGYIHRSPAEAPSEGLTLLKLHTPPRSHWIEHMMMDCDVDVYVRPRVDLQ
jgi:hypothetical protein